MRQAAPILRCCLRQPLVLSVSQLPHRSHLQGSGHPPNFLRTKTQVRSVILASFAMAGPLEPQADRVLKFWSVLPPINHVTCRPAVSSVMLYWTLLTAIVTKLTYSGPQAR